MSTTLHPPPSPQTRLPHRQVDEPAPRPTSRPNAVDRLALRLGLLLITYGRRRHAAARDLLAHRGAVDRTRLARELAWERSARLLLPPR